MKKCKGCGRSEKTAYNWFSNDICSRSCALNLARELKEKYWEVVRLLNEKK